jgi:hypothetical protein
MHIAALLRGPVPHRACEVLLGLGSRPRRDGQSRRREMDRRDRVWMVSGQPSGHPGPEVAAVRDEAVIAEAIGH